MLFFSCTFSNVSESRDNKVHVRIYLIIAHHHFTSSALECLNVAETHVRFNAFDAICHHLRHPASIRQGKSVRRSTLLPLPSPHPQGQGPSHRCGSNAKTPRLFSTRDASVTNEPPPFPQFEIRLCPALLQKPDMPTPHFERGTSTERKKENRGDVFKPPYNPNLYVGELRDEDEDGGTEYVVLVSEFWFFAYLFGKHFVNANTDACCWHSLHSSLHTPRWCPIIALDACFVAQQVLCR